MMPKMPLKVKIYMWYLRRGVMVGKDNLAHHNWHDNKECSFCTCNDTIKDLFFKCKFACSTWSAIQIASNLYPSTSFVNIYGHWLDEIPNRFRMLIRVWTSVLLWSLWLYTNDIILMAKTLLIGRLYSVVCTSFLRDLCVTERSTNRCSRWSVCSWSMWPERFLSIMDGGITFK